MILSDYSFFVYKSCLQVDQLISSSLIQIANIIRLSNENKVSRLLLLGLELSGHGIPWIAGTLIAMLLYSTDIIFYSCFKMFLFGLLLETCVVGIIKVIVRRRRPIACIDDMVATVPIDKFSFPSGHASRSFYVALFTILSAPSYASAMLIWAFAISISRILMGRHYFTDVITGALIGMYIGYFFGSRNLGHI